MSGDEGEKLVAPADFDGPTKNRHCTDLLCFLILIASWVVMTGIGIYAVVNGNLDLVLYPLDFDGNICGTNYALDMTDYPYLLYINSYTGGVCVKDCPNLEGMTEDGLTDVRTLITYNGTWQYEGGGAELPADFIQVGDYSNSSDAISCTIDDCFPDNSTELSWTSAGIRTGYGYAYYAATSYELLYRCYLTTDAEARIAELTGANTTSGVTDVGLAGDVYNFWNKLYADVYLARKYILGFGIGFSMGISLLYIYLMRLPVLLTGVIWTSILTTILLFFLAGYYAWNQATKWDDENPQTVDDQTIHVTTGFSFALFAIGGVLALLACCLRRSIMDAIKCTKEAGRAVNSMVLILLVPVLQAIGLLVFMVPFVYYSANLASLGTITTQDVPVGVEIPGVTSPAPEIAFRVVTFDDFTKNCGWYMLFCFFWTSNFIVAMGDVSVQCTRTSVAMRYR
jgi:Plasma-membrane choline transporter